MFPLPAAEPKFPPSWTFGASGSNAARRGSVSGSCTSYRTAIFATARRAVSGWSAATMAIGSPSYRT
jgi:hypothetical protein